MNDKGYVMEQAREGSDYGQHVHQGQWEAMAQGSEGAGYVGLGIRITR